MSDQEPRLRHEFVGMMFAVAIGEVGLQAAALVQARHFVHFLPAYSHLFLATVVIATSWVGWSLSVAPGARQDVRGVFRWEFVVLLLDVSLVILYFILVRTIDFEKEQPRIDPASTVASWVIWILVLYLVWDCVTKIVMYRPKPGDHWWRDNGSRMAPTVFCLIIGGVIWREVGGSDLPHQLSADFALLCLVLLFRTLKELVSACRRSQGATVPLVATLICACGITLGALATKYSWPLPLPQHVIDEITTPLPGEKPVLETPAGAPSSESPFPNRRESTEAALTA